MKRLVRKITLQSIAYLMFSLVGLLIVNKALFMHVHRNNGQIITHAHPYNQSEDTNPNPTHHHNNAQYLFFNNLNILFLTLILVFFSLIHKISTPYPVYIHQDYKPGYILPTIGRDPPLAYIILSLSVASERQCL